MNLRQAFIAAYYYLEVYYNETISEDILDIISSMNPFLWADGGSADPAAEHDWIEVAKNIMTGDQMDSQQAFQVMYEYVKFFKTEFGFDFDRIMEGLLKKTHNDPEWLKCVAAAVEM